jgi:AbrB family looped-hinge helix DNA binding protein
MAVATLTSKGQVTIPVEVREKLNLRSGDRIDFRFEPDGSVRLVPLARKVRDVFGMLAEKATRPYSSKEARAKLREAFRKGKL